VVIPAVAALLAAALLCLPDPAARGRVLWPVVRPPSPSARTRALVPLLGGVAGFALLGPGGALAGVLIATTVRRRRRAARAAAAGAGATAELAAALGRIADELAAGAHPAAALAGSDADGPAARAVLAPAAEASRLGDDVPRALRRAARDRPDVRADVERLAAAWALADEHGVPLAGLLDGARRDLGWRVRFAARVRAELAGPRATAGVLTGLPLLGLGLGQLVGAAPLDVLRSGPLGQVLLVAGVGLVAAGAAWSDRILRSAVPR
jgi:tight adherence protein B